MALDPTLSAELDKDWAAGVSSRRTGQDHAMERLRGNFDQDGRAVGAAIASVLIQASLPEQAMSSKLADRTPSSPAMSEPPNPQTQVADAK